ncbi:MAG TPA: hypothetical protein DEF27_02620, partial [Oscillatoriales bacterium UBA8482]|nr:hypothetical protein [Oscillatoriales bacterium UBA8482]
LYSPRDRYLQEFFIKGDNPPPEIILEIYEVLKNYDSDTVLITYAELAGMLSDKVPEMAVGTAIKILEREGYVTRSHDRVGQAYMKLRITNYELRIGNTYNGVRLHEVKRCVGVSPAVAARPRSLVFKLLNI